MTPHVCWCRAEFYAWDCWNEIPRSDEYIYLMLNGGWAYAPTSVSVVSESRDYSAETVSWGLYFLEPSIGAVFPRWPDTHALLVGYQHGENSFDDFQNEDGDDWEALVQGNWYATFHENGYFTETWRIWDVLPADNDMADNPNLFDEQPVVNFIHGDVLAGNHDPDEGFAALLADSHGFTATHQEALRQWDSLLSRLAPRHDCAALLLDDLRHTDGFTNLNSPVRARSTA